MEDEDASIYYDKFAAHLPESTPETAGRKLWGKIRENDKLKQLNEKCKIETTREKEKQEEMMYANFFA